MSTPPSPPPSAAPSASEPHPADLPPRYVPADVEPQITRTWDAAGAYRAAATAGGPPFSICIPPPNVTAALHLGHALNNTLQDVLTRAARMKGFNTVWLPGTDHAGIATQTVVDKRLQASGEKSLKDYKLEEAAGGASGGGASGGGRDEFIEKVQAWKDEYEARITQQLKDMGCSCDWDRQAFTMDEPRAAAVREAFFQLFKDGLIYRGKRLVNWDPVTQTALADDEVEMQDVDGHFYYMKYPVVEKAADGVGGYIETGDFVTVATTRPETMLGDTAVAVNARDTPRAAYIGKLVKLPIVGRVIPIIADDYVVIPDAESEDPKAKMASGFLKVTPAHDPNDYDIGQRHTPEPLPIINVMAPDASISKDHGWPPEEWPAEEWPRSRKDADAEEGSAPEASGITPPPPSSHRRPLRPHFARPVARRRPPRDCPLVQGPRPAREAGSLSTRRGPQLPQPRAGRAVLFGSVVPEGDRRPPRRCRAAGDGRESTPAERSPRLYRRFNEPRR